QAQSRKINHGRGQPENPGGGGAAHREGKAQDERGEQKGLEKDREIDEGSDLFPGNQGQVRKNLPYFFEAANRIKEGPIQGRGAKVEEIIPCESGSLLR